MVSVGGHPRVTLAVLIASAATHALLQSSIVPTLTLLQREFRTDQATATWILTIFLFCSAISAPIVGRLGDSYGKRRMLIQSLMAMSAGAVIASLAANIETMIAVRAVQGLDGGVVPLAFAIVRDEFQPARVPSGIAVVSSTMAGTFGLGIWMSGLIADHLSIRALFLIPAILAATAAVAALAIPESRGRNTAHVPLVSTALLTAWLICLLLAVTWAPEMG